MANYRNLTFRCEKCGEYFEERTLTLIRVNEDINFKEDFLKLKHLNHVCPKCNYNNFLLSPFLYVDDTKKYGVINNSYDSGLTDRMELKEEFPGYDFYISDSAFEFPNIVNSIDFGFDPFVTALLCYDIKEYIESKFKELKVIRSNVEYSSDGSNMQLAVVLYNEKVDDYTVKRFNVTNMYNETYEKSLTLSNGKDPFVVSSTYIKKLYQYKKDEISEEAQILVYEFAICRNKYGEIKIAFVQSFNEGKFKEGDHVALIDYIDDESTIYTGIVDKVIHMSDIEFGCEINDIPVVTYKTGNMAFETTLGSNDELHNERLKENIKSRFKNGGYDEFLNSNIIVPMKYEIHNNKYVPEFKRVESNGKIYLALYLDQEDVKDEMINVKLIYDVKSVLYQFFNIADRFDGILINPESDNFKFSIEKLLKILTDRIMTNVNLMQEFLSNVSEDELHYIGKDNYKLIKEVYFSNASLIKTREKLGLSEKETDSMLQDGYRRIKLLLRSKELSKMPIEKE